MIFVSLNILSLTTNSMNPAIYHSSRLPALLYLSIAMTIPFMLPIKTTINQKDKDHIGNFSVGNAFRI